MTPGSGASVSKAANNRRERERKIQATFFFFFFFPSIKRSNTGDRTTLLIASPDPQIHWPGMECTKVDRKVAGHDSVQFAGSL